ncbi:MAG: transposase [Anaerolineae bacterium]|nr:transposase [Anaerolineae bacterium]MDQ7035320.1 transposase [Anaerolineae bacterium]
MFQAKRVLIITREVKFATNAIATLEKYGYEVTTFTNSRPALDFLRQNPQSCALLDFRVNDMSAPDTLDHMRAMQPDIALIAAPNHPAVHNLKEKHNIQAIINIPYPLRRFVDVLEEALKNVQKSQPDKGSGQSSQMPDTSRSGDFTAIEFWVSNNEGGDIVFELGSDASKDKQVADVETTVFDKLAAEEPPMPSFEEGSTIRDLRDHLKDPHNVRRYLEVFSDDSTARNTQSAEDYNEPNADSRSIPAAVILETAMDESTPIRTFSLNEFMSRAQESGKQILVPPSWLQEDQKYFREPEFLPDDLLSISSTFEYTVTRTTPNEAQQQQIETDPTNLVTDLLEPVQRSHPSKSLPEEPTLPVAEVLDEEEAAAHTADFEKLQSDAQLPITEEAEMVVESATAKGVAFSEYDKSNPYVAQLALTLTQVSLELSVEASVLVNDGEIIAYSGNLPREDIEDLRGQLETDWNADGGKSRIRFITLPGSGADYMLFTCQTESSHTLSMIFGGLTPLHIIRRQGKRLSEALAIIPEPAPTPESSPEKEADDALQVLADEDVGERVPRTLLWILRNAATIIPNTVAQAIIKKLNAELKQQGWQVHEMEVHQDFVYFYGDMPVSYDVKTVIRDLMQSTATLVSHESNNADTATLWDDSYLVLQPGRKMEIEEIQRFINFARE